MIPEATPRLALRPCSAQAGLTHGHPTGLAAAELTAYGWVLLDGATLAGLPARLRDLLTTTARS
jgi:hypothetical protein